MSLTELDDKVVAATIAAAGTVVGALIQLRAAWRREVTERSRGTPLSRKSRRGPILAVLVLMTAAAVGGFALARGMLGDSERENAAVRADLRAEVERIRATTDRLSRAGLAEGAEARGRLASGRPAPTLVAASLTVGPCRPVAATTACQEADALPVELCAAVPAAAFVTDSALYIRRAPPAPGRGDGPVEVGEADGEARFPERPVEHTEPGRGKLVCVPFVNWSATATATARLEVLYVLGRGPSDYSDAALTPSARLP
ncbi:MAG: hypothetical protein JSR73_12110 [Proteobacteria bacterium]|nr:hypothetical protein [Pseudomonadota bacterium]